MHRAPAMIRESLDNWIAVLFPSRHRQLRMRRRKLKKYKKRTGIGVDDLSMLELMGASDECLASFCAVLRMAVNLVAMPYQALLVLMVQHNFIVHRCFLLGLSSFSVLQIAVKKLANNVWLCFIGSWFLFNRSSGVAPLRCVTVPKAKSCGFNGGVCSILARFSGTIRRRLVTPQYAVK